MTPSGCKLIVASVFCLLAVTQAYYLPGAEHRRWAQSDSIRILASKLSSDVTQLPYEYYELNYCHKNVDIESRYNKENYGMALSGIVLENSPYVVQQDASDQCRWLCNEKNNSDDRTYFEWFIDKEYRANYILDNMPALHYDEKHQKIIAKGVPIGVHTSAGYHVFNHYNIRVMYNIDSDEDLNAKDEEGNHIGPKYSVIQLHIQPFAINYGDDSDKDEVTKTCNTLFEASENTRTEPFTTEEISTLLETPNLDKMVHYTYRVEYQKTDVTWKERWAEYLQTGDDQGYIHWLSILNSCMVVIFLTGIVAHILSRTLNKDIATYNSVPTDEEFEDESGWKQLQGDVFRPPRKSMLLSALVGNGSHLLLMISITVVLSGVGVLSPSYRGGLLTAIIYMFVLTSNVAGYVSARMYKMMNGPKWFKTTLLTAMGYSGVMFSVFFVLNLILYSEGSSGAVSFVNLFTLLCLWFLVSTPFTFLGSFLGYKKDQIENPCRVNKIPRPVPQQKWYLRSKFTVMAGGLLPFGSIFIEMYFIMSSIWGSRLYYMFGLLFLVLLILIFTCAEISIVVCYFQLCKEDYRWWWRSFMAAGATGIYLFGYSLLYFFFSWETTRLSSTLLYFGYMSLLSVTVFIITGTVGFLSTYIFVRQIYQLIHAD